MRNVALMIGVLTLLAGGCSKEEPIPVSIPVSPGAGAVPAGPRAESPAFAAEPQTYPKPSVVPAMLAMSAEENPEEVQSADPLENLVLNPDYERVVTEVRVEVKEGPFVEGKICNLGPVALTISSFFGETMGGDPTVWIQVYAGPIPNVSFSQGAVVVDIDSVTGASGPNLYDAGNDFEESSFFHQVSINNGSGIRTVHLTPGATEEDVQRIRGTLRLRLPTGIHLADLDLTAGKPEWKEGNLEMAVLDKGPSQVVYWFSGSNDNVLQRVAYNAAGKALKGVSVMTTQGASLLEAKGAIARLKIVLSEGVFERSYPFELTR